MTDVSNAELALLSLLAEQPCHGYQIEQMIEERNMRYWTEIGFSSIYRVLKKLEKEDLVSAQMQPPEGRGPARKVYHLTEMGQSVWQQAALKALAQPEHKYSSFLLGLDNLGALPPMQAQKAIKEYLNQQRSVYQGLNQAVNQHPLRDDFYIAAFFEYLLHDLKAEIEWLDRFTTMLTDHNKKSIKNDEEM